MTALGSRIAAAVCVFLLSAVVLGADAQESEGERIEFGFAPTAGARWLRSGQDVSLTDVGGGQPVREYTTVQEVELVYTAAEDGVWRVDQTPQRAERLVDGAPSPNLILDLTVGSPYYIDVTADGTATDGGGFRTLFRRLENELPGDMFQRVSRTMNDTVMLSSELSRWNQHMRSLRGRSVQVGDQWKIMDWRVVAGSAAVPIEGILSFDGWTEIDGTRALRISYKYDSSGDLAAAAGDFTETLNWRPEELELAPGNMFVEGEEIKVIVPATGQMIYRTRTQHARMQQVGAISTPQQLGSFETSSVYRWRQLEAN